MKENFFTTALKNITGAVLLLYAVGWLIIGFSLSNYNLSDSELLKPRAVAVGLTFIILFIIHNFYFLDREFLNKRKKGKFLTVIEMLSSYIIFTILLFILCVKNTFFNEKYLLSLGNFIPEIINVYLFFLVYWLISSTLMPTPLFKKYGQPYKTIFVILNTISFIFSIIIILIFRNNRLLKNIIEFEFIFSFLSIFAFLFFSFTDKIRFTKEEGEIPKSKYSFQTEKNIHQIFMTSLYTIIIFALCFFYSTSIFPIIDQSLGGGKLEPITYLVGTDTIKGNKIHETNEYVFLFQKGGKIKKLDWKDIEEIQLKDTIK